MRPLRLVIPMAAAVITLLASCRSDSAIPLPAEPDVAVNPDSAPPREPPPDARRPEREHPPQPPADSQRGTPEPPVPHRPQEPPLPGRVGNYEVIELGSFGGTHTVPTEIDAQGRVLGSSTDSTGTDRAFIWDGQLRRLDASVTAETQARLFGNGFIAGTIHDGLGSRAVIWENGSMREIGVPGAPASVNAAGDILVIHDDDDKRVVSYLFRGGAVTRLNHLGSRPYTVSRGMTEAGAVVGFSHVAEYSGVDHNHAFIWQNGVMRDLGTIGQPACSNHAAGDCSHAEARGVNRNGDIIGYSINERHESRAVLWRNGAISEIPVLPGWWTRAERINNRGQILITASNFRESRALLWEAGQSVEIVMPAGLHLSDAFLNERGTVAGILMTTGVVRAFVWDNGTMLPIGEQTAPGAHSYVTGFNERGDIIGYIETPGRKRAVLWRRIQP